MPTDFPLRDHSPTQPSTARQAAPRTAPFDVQASTFDERAGLPALLCQAIAQAVVRQAKALPGDLILEVGAGTGMLGTWLARAPQRYVGFDLSHAMLAAFHRSSPSSSPRPLLLQADGDQHWPLADGVVRAIFSSRALHLLDLTHVVDEICRLSRSDGASLLIGRIQRPTDSLPRLLQQTMQRILRQRGFSPRAGEQHQIQLLSALAERGGRLLEPLVAVRWPVTRTPWQSIQDWQSKPGLAGLTMSPDVQRSILAELCNWAESVFGDLRHQVTYEDAYVLQGISLTPRL
jgi:ubiquinone/menaquinone biosynthesis C-methylase UbiE